MKPAVITLFTLLFAAPVLGGGLGNPGLKALTADSSAVIVVEVLETSPSKAIEGARDIARLRVVRSVKGSLAADEVVAVYYHLLWADTERWVLEKPKFEKGKQYLVFHRATPVIDGENRRIEYRLAVQWLGVLAQHPELEREVARYTTK